MFYILLFVALGLFAFKFLSILHTWLPCNKRSVIALLLSCSLGFRFGFFSLCRVETCFVIFVISFQSVCYGLILAYWWPEPLFTFPPFFGSSSWLSKLLLTWIPFYSSHSAVSTSVTSPYVCGVVVWVLVCFIVCGPVVVSVVQTVHTWRFGVRQQQTPPQQPNR